MMTVGKISFEKNENELMLKLVFVFGFTLVFIYPYLSCVFFLFLSLMSGKSKYNSSTKWIALGMFLSGIYLISLINASKVPESDLIWYLKSYSYSVNYDFSDFILFGSTSTTIKTGKEPLYGAIVWGLNRLLNGNVNLFKFFMSVIEYFFLVFPFFVLGRKMKNMSLRIMVCGAAFMLFFPYVFTMSMHLLRQFLADSVVVFVLILACFGEVKRKYVILLTIVPALIHSTAFLFIPLILLPALEYGFREKKLWYLSIAGSFVLIQQISSFASLFVGSGSSVGYALSRASIDTAYDLGFMATSKIGLVAVMTAVSIYIGQFSRLKENRGVVRFCNVVAFLGFFILVSLKQSELSNRMYFYMLPFIPFILTFASIISNKMTIIFSGIVVACLFLFPFFVESSTWHYILPDDSIWIVSLLNFF